jgi:queuine tRNA-ribosyltransferase
MFEGDGMTYPAYLDLDYGRLELPAYLPDATFGVVRAVDAEDLLDCGVQAVVMNTFHLMQKPGSSTIQALGGLHRMAGWTRPIFTDSGGFQAYSLIRQNAKFGSLSEKGILFKPEGSERKLQLTPEKCIQLQMSYGSDVVICLDDCTHVDASHDEQRRSVERTIAWAKRCKAEFLRLVEQKGVRLNCAGDVLKNCWRLALTVMVMAAGPWTARASYWWICWN